jgi:hypothetical protein
MTIVLEQGSTVLVGPTLTRGVALPRRAAAGPVPHAGRPLVPGAA